MSTPGRKPLGSSLHRRTKRPVLLPQRVLETTDSVLDLALDLVGLAVSLQLGVACRLGDGLLDRAFDFLGRARDPILIHYYILLTVDINSVHRSDRIKTGSAAVDSEST